MIGNAPGTMISSPEKSIERENATRQSNFSNDLDLGPPNFAKLEESAI